jgi:hypothetical protein
MEVLYAAFCKEVGGDDGLELIRRFPAKESLEFDSDEHVLLAHFMCAAAGL